MFSSRVIKWEGGAGLTEQKNSHRKNSVPREVLFSAGVCQSHLKERTVASFFSFFFFTFKTERAVDYTLHQHFAVCWWGVLWSGSVVSEMMKVHLHWRDNQAGHGWNRDKEKVISLRLKQVWAYNRKIVKILQFCVCAHACVCVLCVCVVLACVQTSSHLMLHKCVNVRPEPVCVCACECLPCPPAIGRPPNKASLKPSLLLWHFSPPARQPRYVWYFSWRWGNGKQWPRLPGDAAAVTAEQQRGDFPQRHDATALDTPQAPLQIPSVASSPPLISPSLDSPTPRVALVPYFHFI